MTDSEAYYRGNVAISFINHIILELDEKFPDLASFAANILGLVPSVLCSVKFNVNVEQLKNKYAEDLPSLAYLEEYIFVGKMDLAISNKKSFPTTATAISKSFDSEMYPNIFPLIKICCIIPASYIL